MKPCHCELDYCPDCCPKWGSSEKPKPCTTDKRKCSLKMQVMNNVQLNIYANYYEKIMAVNYLNVVIMRTELN